jgi:hypothetical protein
MQILRSHIQRDVEEIIGVLRVSYLITKIVERS